MALWDKIQNGTPNNSSATKTPYQQNFSQPIQQEWKLGDKPTNYGQALATINQLAKTDPTKAQQKLTLLNQFRTQPGNIYYDAYSKTTNGAVNNLASYGIDARSLTPEWFQQNTGWQNYLSYNGTTNTPSKPGKKASQEELIAYDLYQYQKGMDTTGKAKSEWAAAQQEIAYWAGRSDLNLSDDDIIRKVFGSNKYSTLKKMDDTRTSAAPLELNEAIGYNADSVRGTIWAARNNGGTGNSRQDIANYYLKSGNSWKDDPNISAKLNIDNLDTFSRYEVGMAGDGMDKAGVYFGVPSFSKADVEALRNNVDWEDETSVKMYQTVLAAEETTEKAETELENLTKAFQRRLNRGFKDQNEANKWIDSQLESSDYSTLAKMDASLKSGKIMDMTRAVPYRKQMLQQMAADAIANPKKTGNEIMGSYGVAVSDGDDSVTKVENDKVGSAIDALGSFLSQGEKDYFDAVPGVEYAKIAAGLSGIAEGMKSGMINITNNATQYAEEANGKYNKTWLGSLASRNEYERYQAVADRLAAEVEDFEKQNGTQILASESIESEPVFSLDDGTQVQLIYDDETGEYEVGNVWNDMWRFGQISPEQLAAANEKAEQLRIEQNNRASGIRSAQAEAGEMDADTIKGVEEYNKKKEQLAALNGYLDENKAGYEQSIRDAEIAKANRDGLGAIAAKALGIEYDPSTADSIMQYAGGWYDYDSPPADGITLIEESAGKSDDDIKAEIDANNANVQDLQFVLSMLGDNAPEDLKQKINQAISDAERQNRVYGDYMITKNPRFDYLARKGQESLHFTEMDEPVEGMNKNWFFMMSDDEKKIYYALVNTDGIDAADRFYTDIRDELQQRRQNQIEGVTKQIAESGWLGRLASEVGAVLIAPINTLAGAAYTAGVALGAADEAEMSAAKQSSHISQSMHNANVTEIKNIYGEDTALGKALSGVYEIMYNRGNSLMNALTWGKLMPQLAAEGKVAGFINSVISATPIALSAASDALESAIDRGADPTQQAIIFASTLIAESWTEGIEFGHIEEAGKLLLTKKGITTFLKNYIPNALSEVVGESANDLIENAADYWVKYINNPDYQTEHDNAVKKALAEDDTLTPEQAEALVHQAEVDGVLHTAIISFFSPGADVVAMAGNTLTTYYGYAKEARAYNNGLQPQVRLNNSKSIRDIRLEHEAAQQGQPVRVERQEEAPQTEQTEQAEPEQYPVNGPEPNTRSFRERGAYGEAMDAYETGIMTLESAMEADATTKAAAIAATINTGNPYMAQAAAAKLDIGLAQGLLYAGKQNNINIGTLSTGLQLAALGDGMCAEIMNTGIESGMGIYDMAQKIAAAVGADMQNPGVMQGVAAGIHDARVNEEFKRLMATGLGDAAVEAQAKVDAAREATKAAEQEAEQKNNELEAARKGVSDAAAAVAADPINDGNQMTGALAKMTSAAAVAQEYAQKLDKARKDQQKVEDDNRKAIETTTAYMRQQAEKTVAQQEAEENAQAQAEAQAKAESERAEQMARNITTLQTEDFVEKYYPNATEEQKENIAQRIDYMKQQTSAEAILDRAQFVKSLSNKFGTKIRVADTTEGGSKPRSNAYVDVNTGEIVVDRNSTMSDIIYAVLPHELMHLAEKSGNYKALADTLLQIKYGKGVTYDAVLQAANGGNRSEAMATAIADLLARKTLYDERLGSTHTNEYALQETVADLMGGLFRSGENGGVNSELVNRLVAEEPNVAKRIMNAIKSFIRKMAGFNDPALTQAQAAVDMLNAALKERTASTNTKAQNRKADKSNHAEYEIRKSQFSDNPTVRFNTMPSEAQNAALRTIGMIPYKDSHGWGWRLNRGVKLTADQISKALAATENSTSSDPIEFANEVMAAAGINNVRHSLDTKALVTDDQGNELATELPGGTVYVSSDPKYSLSTFTDDEQTRVVRALLNQKDDNGNNLFTYDQVKEYLKNARGIAAMIAADRARLDFEADKDQVFLKKNQDYYFTLDASTLCAKRLLYQGTFNAIQKMMPNEALMPDDLIDLVNIMREMGYETPCGICYVESRRRWLDKYAQEWLDSFKGIEGEPMPTLADLTTSDGLSEMNVQGSPKYAPKTRQAFIDAMSAKGSANPKVVQLRTEYNGDIRKLSDSDIQKVKDIGGLRIQSFSDFETPHLLDMIQAVYDMAAVRLTSQAYTKVPNFAWVFGDTGIKINLSLIGKGTGIDADGNLVFDDVEGMNFEQAMRLRDRYSKNVGTILVGINDEHIIAAMGDPRIDFIIPFHKSGWSHGELSRIPVLNSYKDYTATQNEQYILEANIVKEKGKGQKAVDNWIAKNGEKYPGYKVIDEGNGQFTIEYRDGYKSESFTKHKERTGEKLSNFEPVGANQYWNFDESGEWNARKYLQMCAESKRLPKFYQFLVDNGDGSFSLPEGNDKRSTAIREGYWKTLIDFKMYENDGYGRTKEDGTKTEVKGSRQTEVTPNVNMQQAERVMNEHKLGRQMPKRADGTDGPFIPMKSNNDLPTAEPAAEAFAEFLKYKRQRQEEMTRDRLARNPKKESDDARNKRIAREGAEIYQAYSARNAFGASANIPLMDQTADTSSEEPVQAQQSRMAIDPETGEAIRYSLPSDAPYIAAVERGEGDEYALAEDMAAMDGPETHYGDRVKFSLQVVDPVELEFLNNQETIHTFKTMQLVDGKLYPPMNAVVAGSWEDNSELGKWEKATEHPELIRKGNKFNLNKGKGQGTVSDVAYNPYMHSSNLMINDQFKGAWNRPNLVTVECEVPASEADGAYHAEFAKDSTGWHAWHSGDVATALRHVKGVDRQVFLSRWIKPIRIVPDSEVAQHYKELLDGTDIQISDKVVPPSLLAELKKAGVPIKVSGEVPNSTKWSLPSPEVLDQQIRHYLTAPLEGENPSATIPSEGNAQRQFGSQTAQRSDELDASVRQFLKDNSGYIPDTNEAQINRAIQWIRSNKNSNESDGLAESIQKIAMENFDYRSADGQARMIATIGLAVAKNDVVAQVALADAYNRQRTDIARALQAGRIFRLMTPAGRVATLQKMLQNTQDELAAKGRNIDLKFSDWIYMAASAANNEGDFQRVQKRAAEELAEQIPANWKDKLRTLRMLSMLGNPRTHMRNIIGNALFVPAVSIKNKLGAVAELGLKPGERTKTLRFAVDKSIRDFAKQDAIAMKDDLTGDSRWSEGDAVRREVKPFKGFMQKLVDANGNALEFEDWFFLKGHYTRALGGWMQANGYTAEQMRSNPALLEKGRAYAVEEAQKATYRDANKLAQTLNKVSREGGVAGFLVDAVLPFKKTPANILRRGIEYSPVGIMKTLTADAVHLKQYMDAKNGKLSVMPDKAISPNQFIDHLCAGLTGSAIMAVGALLASMGIASAGMDDDDDKFDELRGGQEYSFKVNLFGQDVTYTMDWAAPMSMPFFVGAAIFDQLDGERGDFNVESLINDLGAMAEPVFNLSMLDGVNTLFQTSQYDDTNTITQIGGKIASNYVTSYIPSLLGGIARTVDPVRRKSFVKAGEGGGLMGTFRYAIEQTQNKIPGLSQQNIAYRNAWGEADESSTIEKIFENFLSPGYISSVKEDPVLDELERLYNSTEVDDSTRSNLIPKLPNKSVSGTALEAEQYDAVTIQRGQTAKNLLTELMNTDYFKSAADQDRASMVADVWTFSTQTANNAAVGRKLDGWVLNTQTNPVQGIINRSKKTVADETKDGWKAEAVQAVQMGDFDALDVCIERLGELGVKKSSVKTAVGNAFKEDYIKAYQRNDFATMYDIEGTLEDTGLFTYADFEKWLDDMNKSIEDEEV